MTTTTVTSTAAERAAVKIPGLPGGAARIRWALADTLTITKRNLIAYTRIPEALFFSTLQPIMFVLLFRYVFGGAIHAGHGLSYIDFLMAGIFVQSVAFGGIGAAVGLADDLQKGLIERFRALPMARSAVLAGRTTADLVRNVFVVLLMTGVGAAVGFDFPNGALAYIEAAALVLLFSYALLWGFAVIGLVAPNSETAQVMAFPILFPLIFASPAFVQASSMPAWLQSFATHQPVGVVIIATRALMVGQHAVGGSTTTHVLEAVAWCLGFLVVLAPLAVWRYRRAT
jgi:ABC-2 type transport system permease protein/oleandomycin transport system permease protein